MSSRQNSFCVTVLLSEIVSVIIRQRKNKHEVVRLSILPDELAVNSERKLSETIFDTTVDRDVRDELEIVRVHFGIPKDE